MTHEELQSQIDNANEACNKGDYNEAEQLIYAVLAELNGSSSLPVAKEKDVECLHAEALLSLATIAWRRGNYDTALEHAHQVLVLTAEPTIPGLQARVHNLLGIINRFLEQHDKSLEYYALALAAHEELGEQSGVARITGNIGIVYDSLGDYGKALEYYLQALSAHEELGEQSGIAVVTGNIGGLYDSLGNYDKALEYHAKSLALHEVLGEKAGVAVVTGNIGSLYAMQKYEGYNPAKAEEYLLQAISLNEDIGAKYYIYTFHKVLADLYKDMKRWEDFAIHFEKFYELEKEVQSEEAKKQALIMEQRRQAAEQQKEIEIERTRATAEKNILNNILPEEITQRLIKGENPIADHFDCVSVLFMDIIDFTPLSSSITAQQLVHLLNAIFSSADGVMREFGMEKIKTIGDAYMAVAGAPVVQEDHAHRAAQAALKLLDVMENLVVTFPDSYGDRSWIESIPEIKVRIGLHCGPVAAGVVGENKFLYDLWGDAVNTASRMESHGEAGRIHVSEEFVRNLTPALSKGEGEKVSEQVLSFGEDLGEVAVVPRGEIDIKGKGIMKTYFLERPDGNG